MNDINNWLSGDPYLDKNGMYPDNGEEKHITELPWAIFIALFKRKSTKIIENPEKLEEERVEKDYSNKKTRDNLSDWFKLASTWLNNWNRLDDFF
jgi:hypothetical protein